MGLRHRQQRLLAAIGDEVSSADPGLADLFGVFGRLAADEAMPGHEQLHTRSAWLRSLLRAIARAVLPPPMAVPVPPLMERRGRSD